MFFRLGVSISHVLGLVFLRLVTSNSYLCGLVFGRLAGWFF